MHQQLVVVGGGPAGYAAAFLAADQGVDVTLIDSRPQLGGTCLIEGCIPSKALLHVTRVMTEVQHLDQQWGIRHGQPTIDLEAVRARKDKVIANLGKGLGMLAGQRKVNILQATACLESSSSLRLEGDDPQLPEQLGFDHCILATGSSPAIPELFAIDSPRVMDSTGALQLEEIPVRLLVVGGGYIGLELGTVYARLGSRVSVVEVTDSLLPGVDAELVKPLERILRREFESIQCSTRVTAVEPMGDELQLTFESANGELQHEVFDRVLVATGRQPCSGQLGLQHSQVTMDSEGFIQVDQDMRTADPQILAIGDVAGQPMLAHKATADARRAIGSLYAAASPSSADCLVPAVIFTDPEIAWVGVQQGDHQQLKTATYPWGASGRAQAIGRTEGLTKWMVNPADGTLLGCGIVGPGAGDLIAEAVVAIQNGLTATNLADSIHPHPTLSETLAGAADIYLGKSLEVRG
jgi:dihydrolipoamide dehydrogenase